MTDNRKKLKDLDEWWMSNKAVLCPICGKKVLVQDRHCSLKKSKANYFCPKCNQYMKIEFNVRPR